MMYSPHCGAGSLCLNSTVESLFCLSLFPFCLSFDYVILVFFLNCININKGMVLLSETGNFSY